MNLFHTAFTIIIPPPAFGWVQETCLIFRVSPWCSPMVYAISPRIPSCCLWLLLLQFHLRLVYHILFDPASQLKQFFLLVFGNQMKQFLYPLFS